MSSFLSIKRAAALGAALACATTAAEEMQLRVQRAALFKNGYSRMELAGVLPEGTTVSVQNMPVPVFGTQDWHAPQGVRLLSLTGYAEEISRAENCHDWYALARANAGRKACITTQKGETRSGVIISPAMPDAPPEGAFLQQPERSLCWEICDAIVLRLADGGVASISTKDVAHIALEDGPPNMPPSRELVPRINLELAQPAPGQTLNMSCLAWGLSWLPEYRIELGDNGQAHIEGRIVVLNELIDMDDVELELVTGLPSFGGALISSPLVRLAGVNEYLHALNTERDWLRQTKRVYHPQEVAADGDFAFSTTGLGSGMGSGGMARRQMNSRSSFHAAALAVQEESGEKTEDLYYYNIPHFSCKRGEVAERTLFSASIPYKRVYTCEVPALPKGRHMNDGDQSPSGADVWRCLELHNTGEMPWSTGIVTCYAGGRLISRGTMGFLPAGRKGLLPINKTLEAHVSGSESLASSGSRSRIRAFAHTSKISSDDPQPDVYKGIIEVKNNSDHEMELELTKKIIGTPTEATNKGSFSIFPVYEGNPHSYIKWKLTLSPGEVKTLAYTYELTHNPFRKL